MASQEVALTRKRAEMELMPPPPAPKRIKRPKTVIDEDAYTEGLSRIIARDFFPGLLESETQQEYLDALESKDREWISSASRRLHQVMTPRQRRVPSTPAPPAGQTPRGHVGDTPATVVTTSTAVEDKREIDTNMSLAAFQAKYTSEDNESFYKLLDKQNLKRAEKYAWLWTGNQLPSKRQLKQKEIEIRLSKTHSLTDDGFKKDRLAIKDKDDRPAAPMLWKTTARNTLMFAAEGIEDTMETVAERAQAESRAAPKSIVYENTRMPGPAITSDASVPPSPSLSAVRDAIAGRRRAADQESDLRGDETPRVNGYAFVDDEDPEPESAAAAPLIDLGKGDAAPNPFQIQEKSKREGLHHRMVERMAQSKRTSARLGFTGKVEQTPVPKYPSTPGASSDLTPAAQRLWSKIGSSKGKGSQTPFDGKATPRRAIPGLKSTPR